MDDHTIEPAAKPLADELRQGLHIAETARKDGNGDRLSMLRCVQAALLRIADRIYEVDRRRADGLQYVHQAALTETRLLHERCSTILHKLEALEGQVRKLEDAASAAKLFDAGRQAEIASRREREAIERGEKSWWMEVGKFTLGVLGAMGTVFALIWGLLKLMLQVP